MKIIEHRPGIGVDQDGQWRERKDGDWVPIIQPVWAKRIEEKNDLSMKPPSTRAGEEIQMVKIYRIIEKSVPDFEAEVLIRNGWNRRLNENSAFVEMIPKVFTCNIDESAGLADDTTELSERV